ncbi:MAG: tRNA uridine-5-carboxymethylaminomethyl(34) synthesis GTPase MnmE [Cyanobacteriota bacterium]|nr:tRNA uridine-5-carboxymethylaminomethyl(34) synthesis GTPase MnmE [Cyanobacteriota bacterium]
MLYGWKQGDTIAAIATAVVPQQGSVGIVRVSGPAAIEIAKTLFQAPGRQVWESHRILYGYVRHPQTRQLIDEALLLMMRAPRSYTREDIVEFHCHGGIIVVQQVLQLCLECNARLARPGEFTLRAFANGRIDLTQAESIADLVGAKSAQASQFALSGLQGKLAEPIRQLRGQCLDMLAEIEARVDFEEDLPPLDEAGIVTQVERAIATIDRLEATAESGELLRTGLKVAIVGQPNVGKSSLLNAWSRSDRAIVTDLPGTTRDVVESQLVVGGIPVQVLDTAGIRETEDRVERMGVERSRSAAQLADLVLLVLDGTVGWTDRDEEIYRLFGDRPCLAIVNKIDLVEGDRLEEKLDEAIVPAKIGKEGNIRQIVRTSATCDRGIEDLETAILTTVGEGKLQAANLDFAINQRQAAALSRAKVSLEQMRQTISEGLPFDFWTIDLRAAIQAFSEITGDEVTESVLDRIFSRFCIGK